MVVSFVPEPSAVLPVRVIVKVKFVVPLLPSAELGLDAGWDRAEPAPDAGPDGCARSC